MFKGGKEMWRVNVSRRSLYGGCSVLAAVLALTGPRTARAVEVNLGQDWNVHFDNTLTYNLGMRAQSIDPGIGNNPVFSESDYKFKSAGDIVTNRVADLSELDGEYTGHGMDFGGRVSLSAWHDFAYSSRVYNNPGLVSPGVPYTDLNSYQNNRYSNYTRRYYITGAKFLDAFLFDNFSLFGHATSIKAGRLTEYWGQALFFGSQAISYSQNAADDIKGAASPGATAKELAIPRLQIDMSTQLASDVSLEGQYFMEYYPNRLPEGGTYLGTAGFLFEGPQYLEGGLPRSADQYPGDLHGNYGLKADWSPGWLRGDVALYYRHLDETQPWTPLFSGQLVNGAPVPTSFHLAAPTNVQLIGASLNKTVGDYSIGLEASGRLNTGLNSTALNVNQILSTGSSAGSQGATGDTVNLVANIVGALTRTRLYDTGAFVGEIAFTHLASVRKNANLYDSVENKTACPTGGVWNGCSTTDAVLIAGQFDPSWPQVLPGVDLDAPIFAEYGLYGNMASLGAPTGQGGVIYTAGVHALVHNLYNVTLQYNGYHFHHGSDTNIAGGPSGTRGYADYYGTGNGSYFYNDKGWVSLTLSVSF